MDIDKLNVSLFRYAKEKGLTGNSDDVSLFEKEFLETMYPGMTGNPTELVDTMSSQNPDVNINSEILYKVEHNISISNETDKGQSTIIGNWSEWTEITTNSSNGTSNGTESGTEGKGTVKRRKRSSFEEYTVKRKKRSSSENSDLPSIDLFLNPSRAADLEELTTISKAKYKEKFESMTEKSYKGIIELLWYSANPCYDVKEFSSEFLHAKSMIKKCQWKGVDIKCSAIFKMAPTDQGMCCVLTLKKDATLFLKSWFSDITKKLQKQDESLAFDSDIEGLKNELTNGKT